MSEKKTSVEELDSIPSVSEKSTSLGEIKINHSVVASIVRIATLEVSGVAAVGGGFVDGIREIFRGRESDHGVHVSVNEAGEYEIECRVIMFFGVELATVAMQVQENISEHIKRMTMKDVARVDVVIDGIRMEDSKESTIADEVDSIR